MAIALKLHQSIQLIQNENIFFNNFTKKEKWYIIKGDSQQTLDFAHYQAGFFSGENLNLFMRQNQLVVSWQKDGCVTTYQLGLDLLDFVHLVHLVIRLD